MLYFLPLLDWKQPHIDQLNLLSIAFLWGLKNGKKLLALLNWNTVSTIRDKGFLGILNLFTHCEAYRATFMKHVFQASLPWSLCLWSLINKGFVSWHGRWHNWIKLFSHALLKDKGCMSSCRIISWKKCFARLIWNGWIKYTRKLLFAKNIH